MSEYQGNEDRSGGFEKAVSLNVRVWRLVFIQGIASRGKANWHGIRGWGDWARYEGGGGGHNFRGPGIQFFFTIVIVLIVMLVVILKIHRVRISLQDMFGVVSFVSGRYPVLRVMCSEHNT